MSELKCFSVRLQKIFSYYNSALIAFIITLLTNTLMMGVVNAVSVTSTKGEEPVFPRQTTAQNQELQTSKDYDALEKSVLAEINRVRTNPQAYADWLEDKKQYFAGTTFKLPGEKPIITNRGREALEEAISWLRNLEPLIPLSSSAELVTIAKEQIAVIGSPQNSTNPQQANLSYGKYTPEGIVMQLIIDDGYPDRHHRLNILNPNIQSAGIACGVHEQYDNICAVTYEGDSRTSAAVNTEGQESVSSSNSEVNQVQPELEVPTKEEESTEQLLTNEQQNSPSPSLIVPSRSNNSSLLLEKIQRGRLEEGDKVIPNDGSLYDSYPLQGLAGDSFIISVESQEFDTFLAIMDEKGNIIQQNDDINQGNSNSQLKVTLPSNGIYNIIINAYDQGGKGNYLLTVRR